MTAIENVEEVRRFPSRVRTASETAIPGSEPSAPGETADPASRESTPGPAGKQSAAPPAEAPAKGSSRRRVILLILLVAALAAGAWYGVQWYTVGRFIVSTDDAYVGGDIAVISSKLPGYVAEVKAVANQPVKAGDPLVVLDDGDYRIARDQAVAQVATQKLTLERIDAQIVGAEAGLSEAKAERLALVAAQHNAELTQQRAKSLADRSVASQADLDKANAGLEQANANLAAGDAQISAAEANIAVLKGQRAEAGGQLSLLELAVKKAERDLGFTVLRAPYDGTVGNLAVQAGDLVSAGMRLAAVVPTSELYVDANFKETQLQRLVPGQTVSIDVDALDGEPIKGTIASIAPASGAVFSLLPPENATGNFTKVVQRVPVRIALPPEALARGNLQAGLSVTVRADTRSGPAAH